MPIDLKNLIPLIAILGAIIGATGAIINAIIQGRSNIKASRDKEKTKFLKDKKNIARFAIAELTNLSNHTLANLQVLYKHCINCSKGKNIIKCTRCSNAIECGYCGYRVECDSCGKIIECCQCENTNMTNQLTQVVLQKMQYTEKGFRFFELSQIQTLSPNLAQHILRLSLLVRNSELVITNMIENTSSRREAVKELEGRFSELKIKSDDVIKCLRRYEEDPLKYDDKDKIAWSDSTFEEVLSDYEKIFGSSSLTLKMQKMMTNSTDN